MSAKTTATELSDPGPLYRLRSRLDYLRLRVQVIRLDGPPRSEVDLVHLSAFKRCEAIHLTNLGIADDQLRHLAGLTQLASLDLAGNPGVTDRGLVHLKALTALMYLHLDKTAVTDAGLEHLEQLPNLQMLSVQGTKVTPEGIRQLKQTTPSLTIEGP